MGGLMNGRFVKFIQININQIENFIIIETKLN